MMERGVTASAHCFMNILQVLVERGDMEQVNQIVGKMRAAGVELDAPAYNLLVVGTIRAGDVDSAHSWGDEAVANGVRLARGVKSQLYASGWAPQSNYTHSAPLVVRNSMQTKLTRSTRLTQGHEDAQVDVEMDPAQAVCVHKRLEGTIKDFVASKFGYINCAETHRVYG